MVHFSPIFPLLFPMFRFHVDGTRESTNFFYRERKDRPQWPVGSLKTTKGCISGEVGLITIQEGLRLKRPSVILCGIVTHCWRYSVVNAEITCLKLPQFGGVQRECPHLMQMKTTNRRLSQEWQRGVEKFPPVTPVAPGSNPASHGTRRHGNFSDG